MQGTQLATRKATIRVKESTKDRWELEKRDGESWECFLDRNLEELKRLKSKYKGDINE